MRTFDLMLSFVPFGWSLLLKFSSVREYMVVIDLFSHSAKTRYRHVINLMLNNWQEWISEDV